MIECEMPLLSFSLHEHWSKLATTVTESIDSALIKLCAYTVNAVEHLVLAVVAYVLLCLLLYRCINRGHTLRYEKPFKNARRVLFVTAHPDDECMFFGPTIFKLTHSSMTSDDDVQQQQQTQVYLVCLSNGDKDGVGGKRKSELWAACSALGIPEANVYLYKCTVLPDGQGERWRADVIAQIVLQHIESLDIDTLVTFDKHGVSRHPNHCSIYFAIAYLSMENKLPAYCRVYILESINIIRKYWLMMDMPLSFMLSTHRYILRWCERATIIEAMRRHKSQYVWFRKLYVRFSRYILVNTYQRLDTIDLELDLTIDD